MKDCDTILCYNKNMDSRKDSLFPETKLWLPESPYHSRLAVESVQPARMAPHWGCRPMKACWSCSGSSVHPDMPGLAAVCHHLVGQQQQQCRATQDLSMAGSKALVLGWAVEGRDGGSTGGRGDFRWQTWWRKHADGYLLQGHNRGEPDNK